jgi:hypothetical protein
VDLLLLSRGLDMPKVKLETRDCELSPMMSLRSFLLLGIPGEPQGTEVPEGDTKERF